MKKRKIDWSKYTAFEQKALKLVAKIPKGKVKTYGQIARELGNKNLARAVGKALSKNLDAPIIPCHRVVGVDGLGGYSGRGGIRQKLAMLKAEGFRN